MYLPDLLTAKEVATILRVSQRTVYKMLAEGTLYHVRVRGSIRIPTSSLHKFIKQSDEKKENNA